MKINKMYELYPEFSNIVLELMNLIEINATDAVVCI